MTYIIVIKVCISFS